MQADADAAAALPPAPLLAALNHTTVTFGTGSGALIPLVDFAKPNPNPKYSRIFNPTMFLKLWNPAKQAFEKVPSVQPVNVISLVQ